MYLFMLESAEVRVAKAFQVLALPGALPAVFHCAAGKDRTGIMAGAGAVVARRVRRRRRRRLRPHRRGDGPLHGLARAGQPAWYDQLARQPAAFMAADPAAMAGLLALIRREHGSVREYVRSLGVPSVVLATLEDELLEAA